MAINPQHLRPGNWIYPTGRSRYVVVTGLLLGMMEKNEDFCKEFEGIELTGELLEAAGYTNQHGEGDMLWLPKEFDDEDLRYALSLLNIEDGGFNLVPYAHDTKKAIVKYIHQLQNLYFVISGGSELPLPEEAKILPRLEEK